LTCCNVACGPALLLEAAAAAVLSSSDLSTELI
jgi:hypothetical protein